MLVAKGYRPVNRDQQFLLPPDMREWVPPTHPVWTVIEIVDTHLDTSAFHGSRRTGGAGRAGYDPDMLVTLLIWAWSRGVRSSRQIERACSEVVSYRVICAGDTPDHVTISRFRKDNHTACEALFTQVLILAARLGLGRLETIALDGVKIASNASKDANRTEDGLRRAAEAEAARIAAAAAAAHAATDDAEDDLYGEDDPGPGQVPAELADPTTRSARIAEALAQLDAQKQAEQSERDGKAQDYLARLDAGETVMGRVPVGAEVAAAERRLAEAVAAQQAVIERFRGRTASGGGGGFVPKPVDEHHLVRRRRTELDTALRKQGERTAAAGQRRRNITDPDSRLQPLRGGGWLQGYNCQAFTSADGLILATGVGTGPVDYDYFPDMVDKAGKAAQLIDTSRRDTNPVGADPARPAPAPAPEELIGVMLFDAGYCSRANLTSPGPDRLIATGKSHHLEAAAAADPVTGPPPPQADPIQAMTRRLRTEAGIATYRKRSPIAETVFGHAKHNLGFRRFTSRGLDRARSEWAFHAAVHNLGKILTHLTAGTPLPATS
ncbi:transposase [Rhodococcus jostii]|uniref:transposase n=1 Tax=Rhodococcus jostii TaxID=132919 RepID=UPI003C6E1DA9